MTISSPVFQDGEVIPVQYTCQGEGMSPELTFEGVPATAQSLVLIVDIEAAMEGHVIADAAFTGVCRTH